MAKLERFALRKDVKPGYNIFFIGVGQGGGKIVDSFAELKDPNGDPWYNFICINTNKGDLDKLENVSEQYRVYLDGYEYGAGKDPRVGRDAIRDNQNKVGMKIQENIGNADIIFVVGGMGGGTGTGATNPIIEAIYRATDLPIVVLATLPTPDVIESKNAYNAYRVMSNRLENDPGAEDEGMLAGLFIIDNNLVFSRHRARVREVNSGLSWDRYINQYTAQLFHEWNILTTLPGTVLIDRSDWENVLLSGRAFTGTKEVLPNFLDTYAEAEEDERKMQELISTIANSYKETNEFVEGINYGENALRMSVAVLLPTDTDRQEDLIENVKLEIQKQLRGIELYIGCTTHDSKEAIVYTMTSYGGLPERADNLLNEAQELLALYKAKEQNQQSAALQGELVIDDEPQRRRGRTNRRAAVTNTRRGRDSGEKGNGFKNMFGGVFGED